MFELLNEIKNMDDYETKNQLLMLLLLSCNKGKFKVKKQVKVYEFCINEIKQITLNLDDSKGFDYNDKLITYGEQIFNLLMLTNLGDEDNLPLLQNFTNVIKKYLGPIDTIFTFAEKKDISVKDTEKLIEQLENATDIQLYNRALFHLLESSANNGIPFSDEANRLFTDYINKNIKSLAKQYESLDEEKRHSLLALVDLSYFYNNADTDSIVTSVSTKNDDITFNAIRYFLHKNKEVDKDLVNHLAHNLEYASTLYAMLCYYKKDDMFPTELCDNIYLAKSAMIRWLIYPTELGKAPDKIEYISTEIIKKSEYYIFKFMSDSDNLDESNKNKWLVGWANADGNTFSEFDKLSKFETNKPQKTTKLILKAIKKRNKSLK